MTTSRSTRKIQRIKKQYRQQQPQPCMRCGQPINYTADHTQPDSFSLGHIKSWAHYPELREDPANMRQEHLKCNSDAGADDGNNTTSLGMTSRTW